MTLLAERSIDGQTTANIIVLKMLPSLLFQTKKAWNSLSFGPSSITLSRAATAA